MSRLPRSSDPPADRLLADAGIGIARNAAFFVSGGSEATETAIKLCRRRWVRRGRPLMARAVEILGDSIAATADLHP